MKITTSKGQKQFYNSLGFNDLDLSYFGKGNNKNSYYPVVSLKAYKEVLPKLTDYDNFEGLKSTFYSKNMNVLKISSDKLVFGYFGDKNSSQYEYMTISSSINEAYKYADNWDFSSMDILVIVLNPQKKKYSVIVDLPDALDLDLDKLFNNF